MSVSESDRPLRGEPLGLDLLNTVWASHGAPVDLLRTLDGARDWLASARQAGALPPDPDGDGRPDPEAVRAALVTAREAIRAHLDDPGSAATRAGLNEVLAWGHSWPEVGPDGSVHLARRVPDRARRAGWLAALSYADLLADDPRRLRRCAHPDCVLYFHDTSPKRSRRWCSMAVCGNRAKAARHYARNRTS